MTYALLAVIAVLVGLQALTVGGLIYFAKAAELVGDLGLAVENVDDANAATTETAAALEAEKKRSDSLEREAAHADAVAAGTGWDRLRSEADDLEDPNQ